MINSSMAEEKKISITELPIRYFKMMNGDSIISYIHDEALEGEEVYALEEPMLVTTDDDHRYNLSPWFPFSKENIHFIDVEKVLSTDSVDDGIKNTYLRLVLDKTEYESRGTPTQASSTAFHVEQLSYSKH